MQFLALPLIAFYLSFVATITIVSRQPTLNAQYNYLLFWSYRAILGGEIYLIAQVFWNVVLFIPIGILLSLTLGTKNKWVIKVGIGFLLSLSIEIIQLFSHRGLFEFDDIIHNTLGTVIGIGIYLFFMKLHYLYQH